LKITLFCNKFNSLSQRVWVELSKQRHQLQVYEVSHSDELRNNPLSKSADLIICPFLTRFVPKEIYQNDKTPCLVVHPGIEGDRGVSAIDWALKKNLDEWGVTVLQADEEMDAGDIWDTRNFEINRGNINTVTKSSIYQNEVTECAVQGVLEALRKFQNGISPKPLNYDDPRVKGALEPNMKNKDRRVNWEDSADDIARTVRMSDTQPGAIVPINLRDGKTQNFRGFGAVLEQEFELKDEKYEPGDIVGQRNEAILVKTGSGLLWLSHLKKDKLKLPAMMWLRGLIDNPVLIPSPKLRIEEAIGGEGPKTFEEVWFTTSKEGIAHLHFNFYNGAMSTKQCRQLRAALKHLDNSSSVKMVILMGGYNYFSNGIHLNVIEGSTAGAEKESWLNINAINDVVFSIFTMSKPTISAVGGNAGAGGCMMALASDHVWARNGVVMTPSYKAMNLHGSEYHSFLLNTRVGDDKAYELLSGTNPLGSDEALEIGLFDKIMGKDVPDFRKQVHENALYVLEEHLKKGGKDVVDYEKLVKAAQSRTDELDHMLLDFTNAEYHKSRKMFVYH